MVAKEVQQGSNRANTADVTVFITDENDNAPVFEFDAYDVDLAENSPPGTSVFQVHSLRLWNTLPFQVIYLSNVRPL